MAVRNLERKPWQAFFTALGLALATGIPVVPGAMRDGIAYLMVVGVEHLNAALHWNFIVIASRFRYCSGREEFTAADRGSDSRTIS